ncbi:hypothetical protein [Kaarinaea lacus]
MPESDRKLVDNAGARKLTRLFKKASSQNLMISVMLALLLYGCGNGVNIKHPLVEEGADDEHIAKVYFIRPMPLKFKGIADKKVQVDFKNETLLTLSEGRYTLVKLQPSKGEVTTHSKTKFTNKDVPIEVSRSREYRFIAGKTYFIELKRVDEEFRGIFYDPAPITYEQALALSKRLSAEGAARDEPIDQIEAVSQAPQPSPLEPALPEHMYPGKTYLIKGNPKYEAEKPQPPEDKNEITFDEPPETASDKNK